MRKKGESRVEDVLFVVKEPHMLDTLLEDEDALLKLGFRFLKQVDERYEGE